MPPNDLAGDIVSQALSMRSNLSWFSFGPVGMVKSFLGRRVRTVSELIWSACEALLNARAFACVPAHRANRESYLKPCAQVTAELASNAILLEKPPAFLAESYLSALRR